jgi:hypothetical protein
MRPNLYILTLIGAAGNISGDVRLLLAFLLVADCTCGHLTSLCDVRQSALPEAVCHSIKPQSVSTAHILSALLRH